MTTKLDQSSPKSRLFILRFFGQNNLAFEAPFHVPLKMQYFIIKKLSVPLFSRAQLEHASHGQIFYIVKSFPHQHKITSSL